MKSKFRILSLLGVFALALMTVVPVLAAPAPAPAEAPLSASDPWTNTNAANQAAGYSYLEIVGWTGNDLTFTWHPTTTHSATQCVEWDYVGGPGQGTNAHPTLPGNIYLSYVCRTKAQGSVTFTVTVPPGTCFKFRSVFGAESDYFFFNFEEECNPDTGSSTPSIPTTSSKTDPVCNISTVSAPNWIPYGDANVELRWDSNGCDVHIRSLDGGPWIKLSFQSKSYSTDGGWVGVLARLPVGENGVSPGWNVLSMGTNQVLVWVGHQPPPQPTSWFYIPTLQVLQFS